MTAENTRDSAILTANRTSFTRGKFEVGRQCRFIHSSGLMMLAWTPLLSLIGSTLRFGIVASKYSHKPADRGISYTIFEMTNTELLHTCNASQHLTTTNLDFDTHHGDPQWDWTKVRQWQLGSSAQCRQGSEASGYWVRCGLHSNVGAC